MSETFDSCMNCVHKLGCNRKQTIDKFLDWVQVIRIKNKEFDNEAIILSDFYGLIARHCKFWENEHNEEGLEKGKLEIGKVYSGEVLTKLGYFVGSAREPGFELNRVMVSNHVNYYLVGEILTPSKLFWEVHKKIEGKVIDWKSSKKHSP